MTPADIFKEVIGKFVEPVLRSHGYSRKGLTFYLFRDENYGLINFQKSTKSNAHNVIFTVNTGVASSRLLKFFSPDRRGASLLIDECHWRERLGYLLPRPKDSWWSIDAETSSESFAKELCDHLTNFALPEIQKHIKDEALRDLWLSGRSPGLTNFQRLMNLTVLLTELGPSSKAERVMLELKRASEEKPIAYVAERLLKKLEATGE